MATKRKKEPSDLREIFNYTHKSSLGGESKPNEMNVAENIKCLSRYLPHNRIPRMIEFKLMRIPAFIISLAIFTCISWGSISKNASIAEVFKAININGDSISINHAYLPTISTGLFLGLFLAIMYNISLYRSIVRRRVKSYKSDYVVNIRNAIDSCSWDEEQKSSAIYVKKNNITSAIFLVIEDDKIVPTLVNAGALTEESELVKVYVRYKPLNDGDSHLFPLVNNYGKPVSYIRIDREGNKINIKENEEDGFSASLTYDSENNRILLASSTPFSEQENMLSS